MKATTLQEIKRALISYQGYMAQSRRTGNSTYENMADAAWEAMRDLKEPDESSFGGKIYKEFCGKKMFFPMSEKQAFWVALSFCKVNGLDNEMVQKYWR